MKAMKYVLALLLLALWTIPEAGAQKKLIVKQVERATAFYPESGKACVELISPLEDLHVTSTFGEEVARELNEDKLWVYRFVFDLTDEPKRTLYISAPGFVREELRLAMNSKQKLIFTVFPPVEQFNFTPGMLIEFLYSGTAPTGVRLSIGKRLGGYVSYKTSGLSQEGAEIEEVTHYYDVTGAKEEGYIRQSYTAGLRLGIQRWLYLYLGGGFGEYGRLWENSSPVENGSIDIDLYLALTGIKFEVEGLTHGKLTFNGPISTIGTPTNTSYTLTKDTTLYWEWNCSPEYAYQGANGDPSYIYYYNNSEFNMKWTGEDGTTININSPSVYVYRLKYATYKLTLKQGSTINGTISVSNVDSKVTAMEAGDSYSASAKIP